MNFLKKTKLRPNFLSLTKTKKAANFFARLFFNVAITTLRLIDKKWNVIIELGFLIDFQIFEISGQKQRAIFSLSFYQEIFFLSLNYCIVKKKKKKVSKIDNLMN